VAVSLGLHVLVLGYVALKSFTPPRQYADGTHGDPLFPAPTIYLQIEPRPLLRGEMARTRETPPPKAIVQTIPDAGTRLTETTGATGSADAGDRQAQPSPRAAAAGAPAPPADVGTLPWQVRPRTLGDRIAQGLRTSPLGCAAGSVLSAAERAICDDRFGRRAAAARPIEGTGNPERDARFAREGASRLREYEVRRRPLSGGPGIVGPQDGPGSNFGIGVAGAHLDPSLRPDSTTNIRTRRDGPRNNDAPLTPGSSVTRDPPPR
jgi:hypothetical protein